MILDIAVPPQGIHGLASAEMIFDCGSPQDDVDVLLAACDVRTRTALDIAIATSFTPRFADVLTLPMLLTPRLLLGVASNLGILR